MGVLYARVAGAWVPIGTTGATGPGVAAGGTTNQLLAKNSATDYDTKWINDTAPVVTAWTAVTFQNGWVNVGAPRVAAAYRKVGDDVQVRGFVKSGTIGAAVFTLPAGFCPLQVYDFATQVNSIYGNLQVNIAGNVIVAGANVACSINCQFSTL